MPTFISRILQNSFRRVSSANNVLRRCRQITTTTVQVQLRTPERRIESSNGTRTQTVSPKPSTTPPISVESVCSVCYNNITIMRPEFKNVCKCKITYCKHCILKWILTNSNSCPTCRKKLFSSSAVQQMKIIHKIYSRNNTTPTAQSINRLVQFYENIEHKRRNPLFKIPKLSRSRRATVYTETDIQQPAIQQQALVNNFTLPTATTTAITAQETTI